MIALHEISLELSPDTGAPLPMLLSNEGKLALLYYIDQYTYNNISFPVPRDIEGDLGVATLYFTGVYNMQFGSPSNESISGHRYHNFGLRSYVFYQVENSEWIREVEKMNSVHPYHSKERYTVLNHYLIGFHDSVFECIAKQFDVEFFNCNMREAMTKVLNDSRWWLG